MTEKGANKVSGKKKAEAVIKDEGEVLEKPEEKVAAVIKVDGKAANKADNKPAAVVALAKELGIDVDQLLGWQVYPDRVVIVANNGMKFSSSSKK